MPKRKPLHKTHKGHHANQPFECIALLLQGGGALGAYQAGVYEALYEAQLTPNWVAGISIGAINSAIITGNAPEMRVQKLRDFWESITDNTLWDSVSDVGGKIPFGDMSRGYINQMSSAAAMFQGVHGFFSPRMPPPYMREKGSPGATSYYDTSALKTTLEQFVDFDRINSGETWLSVGATNVKSGNFVYFDTHTHTITPEHIMASGALPPSFAPIEIDGEYYWDGGLVSNTPLQWVLDNNIRMDTLAFQVDLWSAEGHLPRDMAEVTSRQKEILYSSRTRASTDRFKYTQRMRHTIDRMLKTLPPELKESKDAKILAGVADTKVYNIIHLIYHAQNFEGETKDYEFSRLSMEEHWKAGYTATIRSLKHPEVLERPTNNEGVFTFDVSQHGRE